LIPLFNFKHDNKVNGVVPNDKYGLLLKKNRAIFKGDVNGMIKSLRSVHVILTD